MSRKVQNCSTIERMRNGGFADLSDVIKILREGETNLLEGKVNIAKDRLGLAKIFFETLFSQGGCCQIRYVEAVYWMIYKPLQERICDSERKEGVNEYIIGLS